MDNLKSANEPKVVVAPDEPRSTTYLRGSRDRYPNLGFYLFLLVTALAFIRPMDMIPRLGNLPVYEVPFYGCLILCFPGVVDQLSPKSLLAHPITSCVVGMLIAVLLSHFVHSDFRGAVQGGQSFLPIVFYYLLLVAIVNTPMRLRQFFFCVGIFASIQLGIAVLQQHGLIDLPALRPVEEQAIARRSGEIITQYRMCGVGLFHDPNHLAVLAAMTMILCLNAIMDEGERRPVRYSAHLLLPIGGLILCGHGLLLTQSRGGFLAFLAGLVTLILIRFEWKTSAILAAIIFPIIIVLYSGRQTDIHMIRRTTSQMRLNFWVHGLRLFSQSPIFGIGQGNFLPRVGYEAHNSFVQCFAELGFLGGTLFLGAFYLALWPIYRLSGSNSDPGLIGHNCELRQLWPYFVTLLTTWIVGMMSLTRCYALPTFMMLGASASYLDQAIPERSPASFKVNGWLVLRLMALSLTFLIAVYLFLHVFKRA